MMDTAMTLSAQTQRRVAAAVIQTATTTRTSMMTTATLPAVPHCPHHMTMTSLTPLYVTLQGQRLLIGSRNNARLRDWHQRGSLQSIRLN